MRSKNDRAFVGFWVDENLYDLMKRTSVQKEIPIYAIVRLALKKYLK